MSQKTEQFNELMKRPDIDRAAAGYEELYAKVREQVTAEVPALKWEVANPESSAACGNDFAAVNADLRKNDAEVKGLANWVAKGNLPDFQWKHVASTVGQVAGTYGFGGGEVVVDQPGNHEIVFRDQYNAELNFGTAVNTTLLLRTGCHLTAEAKKRGTPAAPPTY
ncbi:LppA family lipoprotein [Amycolatopsis sulphurea]|uniref:LppA family lipoprotein n=1 Tax=Amycolatopsis sulphurea TaxID=76022 RepID=UPI0014746F65|nr:LppA family lipoprotein [Amycolatopsis sulphurea]